VGNAPVSLAFDGVSIWVANEGDNTVTKLRAIDASLVGTFTVGAAPVGVAFDGANIWVPNLNNNTVSKL
jgi:DNA-binding beta-propeller fold protein YncE